MISTEAVRLGYSNVPQTSSLVLAFLKGNALRNENLLGYKTQQHQKCRVHHIQFAMLMPNNNAQMKFVKRIASTNLRSRCDIFQSCSTGNSTLAIPGLASTVASKNFQYTCRLCDGYTIFRVRQPSQHRRRICDTLSRRSCSEDQRCCLPAS